MSLPLSLPGKDVPLSGIGGWVPLWPKRNSVLLALGFVGLYVALDWVSFIYPMEGLNITPWNPVAALSLVLLFLRGFAWSPLLFVGGMAGERLLVDASVPLQDSALSCFAGAVIYSSAAWVTRRYLKMDVDLLRLRDVIALMAGGGAGALFMALAYVGTYRYFGRLTSAEAPLALFEYWVGDTIGIFVFAPLMLVHRRLRFSLHALAKMLGWEVVGQTGAIFVVLWIIFFAPIVGRTQVFYLLFLPLIWVAARRGLSGVTIALAVIQLAIIAIVTTYGFKGIEVLSLQFLLLALSMSGLLLGTAISERERAEEQRHRLHVAVERMSQRILSEELAASLAHELKQPLAALIGYVGASQRVLATTPGDHVRLADQLGKAAAQAGRAGEIVARLRDFFRNPGIALDVVSFEEVAKEVVGLIRDEAIRLGVAVELEIAPGAAALMEKLQIEQVLINLLRNSLEAVADAPEKWIRMAARRLDDDSLVIRVTDSGPGVAAEIAECLFEPFVTTRADGMGLGLAISRSIVENHGGQLWCEASVGGGGVFSFTLPAAVGEADGE